jgi:hypothetical protein
MSCPYKEVFPAGTEVRIADQAFLEEFAATWKYHHKLQPEQLAYADRAAKVKKVLSITEATRFTRWKAHPVCGSNMTSPLT